MSEDKQDTSTAIDNPDADQNADQDAAKVTAAKKAAPKKAAPKKAAPKKAAPKKAAAPKKSVSLNIKDPKASSTKPAEQVLICTREIDNGKKIFKEGEEFDGSPEEAAELEILGALKAAE